MESRCGEVLVRARQALEQLSAGEDAQEWRGTQAATSRLHVAHHPQAVHVVPSTGELAQLPVSQVSGVRQNLRRQIVELDI